jgi:hypothetical protein
MISQTVAAVTVRDGRGRGSACAEAVAASTSRGVGTSVTARTPNACAWSGAGWRRGGRPSGVRTMRPKPSTPRSNVRAGDASHLRRKHRRSPNLRRRVVTQQTFCCRRPCATGQGAMNRPRSRVATRHATAAPPAVRRFAGCWIVNVSGVYAALSRAAAHATRSTRQPVRDAAPTSTTQPARHHHGRRPRDQAHRPRRSAVVRRAT